MADEETIETIKAALSGTDEDMTEQVIRRLDTFGYEVTEADAFVIGFSIQKASSTIKNDCGIKDIPEGLMSLAVDMSCGEFLLAKKQTGQLDIAGLDLSGAVASLKEGDTQISFNADESDSDKLDSLINHLMNSGRSELACYRRIQW